MAETRYTESHEYVRIEGASGTIGITQFAQAQLGDVVFVELPVKGTSFAAGAQVCVVESVKAAGEIFAPVGGEVTEVNSTLEGDPALVNADPEGAGWLFKVKTSDAAAFAALMDKAAYDAFVAAQS